MGGEERGSYDLSYFCVLQVCCYYSYIPLYTKNTSGRTLPSQEASSDSPRSRGRLWQVASPQSNPRKGEERKRGRRKNMKKKDHYHPRRPGCPRAPASLSSAVFLWLPACKHNQIIKSQHYCTHLGRETHWKQVFEWSQCKMVMK